MTRDEVERQKKLQKKKDLAQLGDGYGLTEKIAQAEENTDNDGKKKGIAYTFDLDADNVSSVGLSEGLRAMLVNQAYNTKVGYNPGYDEYYNRKSNDGSSGLGFTYTV